MDENPSAPSDLPKPRDSLSRAVRMAKRVQSLLAENDPLWHSGRCSGLRVYGLHVADCIIKLVMCSDSADSAEFDTYLELVSFLAGELEAVMYELLGT
jgi:hypothetical protein